MSQSVVPSPCTSLRSINLDQSVAGTELIIEVKYFQWRKARFDALPVGRRRDKGWWIALSTQKLWQKWVNEGLTESIIVQTPSRSILQKLYNRLVARSQITKGRRSQLLHNTRFYQNIGFLV
jgi:hypothetical protein